MRIIRTTIAVLIAAPIFLFAAWLFLIALNPTGSAGWATSIGLVLVSAALCFWLYRSMVGGVRLRRGFADEQARGDSALGLGMIGASGARRRQQERDDEEDLGV